MSGPKTSHYALTPEQRRALREQLRRQREEALRKKRIEAMTREITGLRQQITAELADIRMRSDRLMKRGSDLPASANRLQKQAEAEISRTAEVAEADLEQARDALRNTEKSIKMLIKSAEKQEKQANIAFAQEMTEKIDRGFAAFGEQEVTPMETALLELETLTVSPDLQAKIEAVRAKAAELQSAEFAEHYYAVTALPLLKACRAWDRLWQEQGGEYEELCARYQLLAEELGGHADPVDFSETAAQTLRSRIEIMEREILNLREQAVISRCIDEVMAEMGYEILGSREIAKKHGRVFHNHVYRYGAGTAVSVTSADDGQITMELGGVDTENRLPTARETDRLVGEMQSFCDRYDELEARLRAKGVAATRLCVLPPQAEYAQILNVSGLNLTEEPEKLEVTEIRRTTGEQKKREVL